MSMEFSKGPLMYEGKAKLVYEVENEPQFAWLEFKDSLSAFNGVKKSQMRGKGQINREIASLIFRYLQKQGVATHWINDPSENEMVVMRLNMLPVEVVLRNSIAGSLAKRFGKPEGGDLKEPLVELYYKDDSLNDPFINDDQALLFDVVESREQLESLKSVGLKINQLLIEMFHAVKIKLVDFKLEFGVNASGEIFLADEITPDSCRLWDMDTNEKMDKDRFRRDLGNMEEMYLEVLKRLNERWGSQV